MLRPSKQEKQELQSFASRLSELVAQGRPFTCLLTNDRTLRKLNRQFLGHDLATDVLSFPSGGATELGDLAISAERAHAQAERFGHSRNDEFRILMLHGVLHLLGYDHEVDRGEMKRAERKWRAKLALPDGLIDRTNTSNRTVTAPGPEPRPQGSGFSGVGSGAPKQ
jgi:probable rRNA maturation factor